MGKRKRSDSFSKDDSRRSDDGESQEEEEGSRGSRAEATRCSARVQEKQEKLRREASPCKKSDGEEEPPLGAEEETRKKRNWELWSPEDKDLFFEALNEFGKDFDSIQSHLAVKQKQKKAVPKNKDQVRHFYYRTWNKISKFLQFPKEMKKAGQELYGLVNYGELRKKQRVLNPKTAAKLTELVEKGSVTIKVRGKTFRIKTPLCRALKKLNRLEEGETSRVPLRLSCDLVPRDAKSWSRVQALSHNPRVRLTAQLQRTLASLISFLEERWKSPSERLHEELSERIGGRAPARLRLFPLDRRDSTLPHLKISQGASSGKISLRAYTANVLSRDIQPTLKKRKSEDEAEGTEGEDSDEDPPDSPPTDDNEEETQPQDLPVLQVSEDTIMRGWTGMEAGTLTLGQLYLLFGEDDRLAFEYVWEGLPSSRAHLPAIARLADLAGALRRRKNNIRPRPRPPILCPHCGLNCSEPLVPLLPKPAPEESPLPSPSAPPVAKELGEIIPEKVDQISPEEEPPTIHLQPAPANNQQSNNTSNHPKHPPRPFLDLPKGNRRLGRRPNAKRVVVPRVLPLLPKGVSLEGASILINGFTARQLLSSTVLLPFKDPAPPSPPPSIHELLKGKEERDEDLSLSSFMEISLPESTRLAASDLRIASSELESLFPSRSPPRTAADHPHPSTAINADKLFDGAFENSNSSLGLGFLDSSRGTTVLETPKKIGSPDGWLSSSPPLGSLGGDLSLSGLLGPVGGTAETDVSFDGFFHK